MLEWLQIILSSPLSEAVTIFTHASGHGSAACYTKDCHKVENAVLPLLKGQSFMLLLIFSFSCVVWCKPTSIPVF
jgi:hypothetical protein